MTRTLLLACSLLLLLIIPSLAAQIVDEEMQEEREGQQEERERWIEQRHSAAPGVDWRVVERENREARMSGMKRGLRKLSSAGTLDTVSNLVGQWVERGSANQAGRIDYAAVAEVHYPGVDTTGLVLYAASNGGHLWRGDIDGKNWAVLNDRERFKDICYVGARSTAGLPYVVVANNSPASFHYSDDGGATWQRSTGLDNMINVGSFDRVVPIDRAGDTLLVFCNELNDSWTGTISSLYRSIDGGRSFHRLRSDEFSLKLHDVWSPRDGSGLTLVMITDSLFTVEGDSLKFLDTLPALFANSPSLLLLGTTVGGQITLYGTAQYRDSIVWHRSLDTGRTWSRQGAAPGTLMRAGVAVSRTDVNQLAVGGVDLWSSEDGGATWSRRSNWQTYYSNPAGQLHADIRVVLPTGVQGRWGWLIGTDGGLYLATPGLDTTVNVSLEGLRVGQYYSSATSADGKAVAAGSQDQGVQISRSGTEGILPMQQRLSGDYGSLSTGDGSATFWSVYLDFTIVCTPDNGYITRTFDGVNRHLFLPPLATIPGTSDRALLGVGGENDGTALWYLQIVDGVITSTVLPYNFAGDPISSIASVAISPIDTNHWYLVTTDGTFYYSPNAGATWIGTPNYAGAGAQYFFGAHIHPSRTTLGRVWVGGSGYSSPAVFVSNNHGATFDSLSAGLPSTLVQSMATDPEERYLFAATEAGPYLCRLDLGRWYDMSGENAPDISWTDVKYVDTLHTARFSTYGRGLWDFREETQLAEVSSERDAAEATLRVTPSLLQSSNGHCTIDVTMPHAGTGSIRVYDATGRVVVEPLRDASLPEGITHLAWDAASVPSGRYMVVLNALGTVRYTVVVKQ